MELSEAQREYIGKLDVKKLPDLTKMLTLESWTPLALAQALEQELARVSELPNPKISIHMNIHDARMLATLLRRLPAY